MLNFKSFNAGSVDDSVREMREFVQRNGAIPVKSEASACGKAVMLWYAPGSELIGACALAAPVPFARAKAN